jgi:hypothetical protein
MLNMKLWQTIEKMSEDERESLPLKTKLEAIDSFLNSTVWKTFRRETREKECCLCDKHSDWIYFDSERQKQSDLEYDLYEKTRENPCDLYGETNDNKDLEDFNIKTSLHLHHIKPMLKYFKYGFKTVLLPENFLTVCYDCHNWIHLREDAREKEMTMFKELNTLSLHGESLKGIDSLISKIEKRILTPKGKPKKGCNMGFRDNKNKSYIREGWWISWKTKSGYDESMFCGMLRW